MRLNTLEATIGNTPLAKIQRLSPKNSGEVYLKLEGNNPAGSVKDRPAYSMIKHARSEERFSRNAETVQ